MNKIILTLLTCAVLVSCRKSNVYPNDDMIEIIGGTFKNGYLTGIKAVMESEPNSDGDITARDVINNKFKKDSIEYIKEFVEILK